MKTETSVVVEKYKDSIFSAAFNVCANAADAEDVVQDTFIRYHTTNTQFADEQHIRAWLLRVAINKAKNVTMSFWLAAQGRTAGGLCGNARLSVAGGGRPCLKRS